VRSPAALVLLTLVALGGIATAAGVVIVWSGIIDVAAKSPGELADRVLGYASSQSLRRHAENRGRAPSDDPEAVKDGLHHYRAMCVACHGGPGVEPAPFAPGLYPPAPDLASTEIQAFSDGMLYRAISGGIGSTGMPGFGHTHAPKDIWSIVAFVRHLPKLSPAETQALGAAADSSATPVARVESTAAPVTVEGGVRVHHVTINGLKFDPPVLEVQAGDAVEWKNGDFVAHTATADDGAFDTGKMSEGQTKRVVLANKGTFLYSCRFHPTMHGTLTVR
jgi:plastocyanin